MTKRRKFLIVAVALAFGALSIGSIAALVLARIFVGKQYVIPQNGMYPGSPAGSRVIGLFNPYADSSRVSRGDVVMFERIEKGKKYLYCWRVIGLPGETVVVDGDVLTIDGKPPSRSLIYTESTFDIYRESFGGDGYDVAFGPVLPTGIPGFVSVTVPPDQFFVMGDNRHNAIDSRTFGPISFESIVAKKW